MAEFDKLKRLADAAGRKVGLEVWTSMGEGAEADWRREVQFWKQAGVQRVTLNTTFNRNHHKRIAGRSYADHTAAIRRWHAAVADIA